MKVLVMTTTYPRWLGDTEPSFIHELSKRVAGSATVLVLCPHAFGAKKHEFIDGVEVSRYYYCIPRFESLIVGGGILANLKETKWRWLLFPLLMVSMFFHLVKALRQFKPDCLHIHWIIPQGLAMLLASLFVRLPPVIVTCHGADAFAFQGRAWCILKKAILKKSTKITVVSDAVKLALEHLNVEMNKVQTVSMGVNFQDVFMPNPLVLRVPGKILFVGRLVEKKGLIYLLNCLPLVRTEFPSVSLTVIGSGPELDALKARVKQLDIQDIVSFKGSMSQQELPYYYQSASVFVAPFVTAKSGDTEGLGLVTLEAIACGCPVLVGAVNALRDIPEIKQWLISDVANTIEFSEKLLLSLREGACNAKNVILVRQVLKERFDWESVSKKHVDIIRAACS